MLGLDDRETHCPEYDCVDVLCIIGSRVSNLKKHKSSGAVREALERYEEQRSTIFFSKRRVAYRCRAPMCDRSSPLFDSLWVPRSVDDRVIDIQNYIKKQWTIFEII